MLIWASDLTSEPSTAANITVGNHKSAETLRVFRFSLMLWCENIVCIYALVKWNDLASVFVTTNTAGDFPTTLLKDIKLFHTYKYWSPVLNSGHWLLTVTPPSSPQTPTVKVGSQTFCRNDSMVHRIWTNVNVSLVCVNVNMLSWRRGWWEIYSSRLNDGWSSMFW